MSHGISAYGREKRQLQTIGILSDRAVPPLVVPVFRNSVDSGVRDCVPHGGPVGRHRFGLDAFDNRKRAQNTYLGVLWRTVWVSCAVTAICLLLGIPVGYWIAQQNPKYRYWFLLVIIIPLWTNFLIRIFAVAACCCTPTDSCATR